MNDTSGDEDLSRGEIGNLIHKIMSDRFDPYNKHKSILKGTFDIQRFKNWWSESRWELTGARKKLRFVGIVRNLQRFDIAAAKAANALSNIVYHRKGSKKTCMADNVRGNMDDESSSTKEENLISKTGQFTQIIHALRQLLSSDRGTLFLVNHNDKTLVSCVHSGEEGPLEIKIPYDTGVAGYVRKTKLCLNVKDAYTSKYFNRSIDKQTGFRTKSILCGVIRHPRTKVVCGVVQLINKVNRMGKVSTYTRDDENVFLKFLRRLEDALSSTRSPM